MKKIIMLIMLISMAVPFPLAELEAEVKELKTFEAGDLIRASEINENFLILREAIGRLETLLQKKTAEIEAKDRTFTLLEQENQILKEEVTKLKTILEALPNKERIEQLEELLQEKVTEIEAKTHSLELFEKENQILKKDMAQLKARLQNGEFLSQQIDAGIERFVQKQQEAQIKEQEEQQHLAQEKAKNVRRVSAERDHIYGKPEAIISLIEYADFECPFCKRFHLTPKKLVEEFDGKVNWVYRHYPLNFHNPGAQKQAEATECASELGGNDAFWKYTDVIYERTTSNGEGFPIENLVPLAEEIGLDKDQFQACLESEKYAERVQEDLKEGVNSGISGTPSTILLNNESGAVKLRSGALPFETLKAEIEGMLNL